MFEEGKKKKANTFSNNEHILWLDERDRDAGASRTGACLSGRDLLNSAAVGIRQNNLSLQYFYLPRGP